MGQVSPNEEKDNSWADPYVEGFEAVAARIQS